MNFLCLRNSNPKPYFIRKEKMINHLDRFISIQVREGRSSEESSEIALDANCICPKASKLFPWKVEKNLMTLGVTNLLKRRYDTVPFAPRDDTSCISIPEFFLFPSLRVGISGSLHDRAAFYTTETVPTGKMDEEFIHTTRDGFRGVRGDCSH